MYRNRAFLGCSPAGPEVCGEFEPVTPQRDKRHRRAVVERNSGRDRSAGKPRKLAR